jgi:hypothetical protein
MKADVKNTKGFDVRDRVKKLTLEATGEGDDEFLAALTYFIFPVNGSQKTAMKNLTALWNLIGPESAAS